MIGYRHLIAATRNRYRGNRLGDIQSYLECRARIAADFVPAHHLRLKAYYRRMFIQGAN